MHTPHTVLFYSLQCTSLLTIIQQRHRRRRATTHTKKKERKKEYPKMFSIVCRSMFYTILHENLTKSQSKFFISHGESRSRSIVFFLSSLSCFAFLLFCIVKFQKKKKKHLIFSLSLLQYNDVGQLCALIRLSIWKIFYY